MKESKEKQKMEDQVNRFPEGEASGIPKDGVSRISVGRESNFPQSGVFIFPLGGACSSLEKWLLEY